MAVSSLEKQKIKKLQSVKFKSNAQELALVAEIKNEIAAYFLTRQISSKANREMILKCSFWLATWMASWVMIILSKENFWLAVFVGIIHMFTHVMIAFNITHDANHGAIFEKARWNNVLGYLVELLGCNKRLWVIAHNFEHHTFVNIHSHDNSVEGHKILRLCPQDKLQKYHAWQWLYAPLVYAGVTLNYVTLRDFKMLSRYISKSKIKVSPLILIELVLFKLLYYSYLIIFPIFVFGVDYQIVLSYFFVGHMINGIFLAVIFSVGHLVESTTFPDPESNVIHRNWAIHVILTTGDYASKSGFMQWLVGAINLHVAHHLFPKICHVHYKNLSPLIKDVVAKHGYVYREIPGFWTALRSHFSLLRMLGRP